MTETVERTAISEQPTLAFIGAGRAGSALARACSEAGFEVAAVHSRTGAHAAALAASTGAWLAPTAVAAARSADLTFLTVPDPEITRVAATIAATGMALPGRALVHCSATLGREVLAATRLTTALVGSLHPLQALSGIESSRLLRGSSFVVDAPEPLRTRLEAVVVALGGHLLELPARGRALYHAAAVLAGNAPLALLARATSLLEDAGVLRGEAHRALAALLAGAASNAAAAGPESALTGPVVRGDAGTVSRHLDVLEADPSTRELYRRLAIETLALAGLQGREAVADVLAASIPGNPDVAASKVIAHPRVA